MQAVAYPAAWSMDVRQTPVRSCWDHRQRLQGSLGKVCLDAILAKHLRGYSDSRDGFRICLGCRVAVEPSK